MFLGGADVLNNRSFFETNKISAVISLGNEAPAEDLTIVELRMQVKKDDKPDEALNRHFSGIIDFIQNARVAGRAVFIHCHAGISRSSTCAAAYLMAHLQLSVRDALAHLVRCRDTVCPNPGFREQLINFEASGAARAVHDTMQRGRSGGKALAASDLKFIASTLVRSKADVDAIASSEWLYATTGKPVGIEELETLADDGDGNGPFVTLFGAADDPNGPGRRRSVARPITLMREAEADWRDADFVPFGTLGFDAQVERLRHRLQPLVDSKQAAPGGLAGLEWLAAAAEGSKRG